MRSAPFIHKYKLVFVAVLLNFCSWNYVHGQKFFSSDKNSLQEKASELINNSSLQFRKNEGQWDDKILYQSSANGANVYFMRDALSFGFKRPSLMNN